MGPKAAAAVPSPAADANPGGAPRDGLQTISRIETSAPAVAAAGSRDATPAAITASSAIAAGDADTNAAVASALGALAAGLAASSAKPAAAQMPAEPVAAQPVAAKAQQPDLVKGLSMSAAARPEVLSVAEVPAATSPASALPPLAAPSAPVPPVDAQVEIPAPVAAPLTPPAAAPAASAVDAPVASEAFLALASTPAAPRAMLPSVIGSHGMLEPESPLDDTVAELLRPMLRQWLADNMPRIVEKALRIELAESLKKEN
jgi:cell pole-organizing protein PopZ